MAKPPQRDPRDNPEQFQDELEDRLHAMLARLQAGDIRGFMGEVDGYVSFGEQFRDFHKRERGWDYSDEMWESLHRDAGARPKKRWWRRG